MQLLGSGVTTRSIAMSRDEPQAVKNYTASPKKGRARSHLPQAPTGMSSGTREPTDSGSSHGSPSLSRMGRTP